MYAWHSFRVGVYIKLKIVIRKTKNLYACIHPYTYTHTHTHRVCRSSPRINGSIEKHSKFIFLSHTFSFAGVRFIHSFSTISLALLTLSFLSFNIHIYIFFWFSFIVVFFFSYTFFFLHLLVSAVNKLEPMCLPDVNILFAEFSMCWYWISLAKK